MKSKALSKIERRQITEKQRDGLAGCVSGRDILGRDIRVCERKRECHQIGMSFGGKESENREQKSGCKRLHAVRAVFHCGNACSDKRRKNI